MRQMARGKRGSEEKGKEKWFSLINKKRENNKYATHTKATTTRAENI